MGSRRTASPTRSHPGASQPSRAGAGPSATWGRGWRGLAAGAGGRCSLFGALIGSELNKGPCLGAVPRDTIGRWRRKAWFCEVSSGWCKTPGAAANGLQMLLGRGGEALWYLCVRVRAERQKYPARDGGDRDRGHGQVPGPAAARAHGTRRGTSRLHRGGERASARA